MLINGKNVHEIPEIEVFLDNNLNFTVKVFTWGLASDHDICKKYVKPKHAKRMILSSFISDR